jgi:hypothetical protein
LLGAPETVDLLLACHRRVAAATATATATVSATVSASEAVSASATVSADTRDSLAPLLERCRQSKASFKFRETVPKPIGTHKRCVPNLDDPDLLVFQRQHLMAGRPVVLRNCMTHWRALQRWHKLQYLNRVAGHRLVPVEVGKDYLCSSSGQKLMTIREFICQHILDPTVSSPANSVCGKRRRDSHADSKCFPPGTLNNTTCGDTCSPSSESSSSMGYIAQHCLFDQIPELRGDFAVPDFCSMLQPEEEEEEYDGASDVLINAWLGPVCFLLTLPMYVRNIVRNYYYNAMFRLAPCLLYTTTLITISWPKCMVRLSPSCIHNKVYFLSFHVFVFALTAVVIRLQICSLVCP